MIVIIIILTGVVVNSGMSAYNDAKLVQYVARMNMVQSRVNIAYTDIKNGNKSVEDYGIPAEEASQRIKSNIQSIISGNDLSDYRYLSKTSVKQDLELEDINLDIVVNFDTREIYSIEGIKYNGVMYYNQYELPNGQYNIDFENKNEEAPEFNISKRNYGLYSYIDVENIEYKENVNGGKIYYGQITGENNGNIVVDYWKETEDEIYVEKTGEYAIKIIDKAGNETVKRVNIVLENAPKLTDEMTAVVYDESKKQWKKVSIEDGKWYDYAENKWANIMMNDGIQMDSNGYVTSYGSMFVWIPRYAYNIKNGFHTSTAGDIEVKFLKGTTSLTTDESNITYSQTSGNDKWLIHPAFEDGTKNGYANGEWNKEIEGIWMAKFETSMETNGTHTETSDMSIGNVLTNDSIKAVSKPGVSSWRNIYVGNMYTNGLNYNKKANSHMIKNSEWGAVAYLTQSKYGRNKQEVTINNSSSYITGNAGNIVDESEAEGITNAYNTEKGVLASTTGNIYGVYDMRGGAWEYTASVIPSGSGNLTRYGSSFATSDKSTRCTMVYPVGNSTSTSTSISISYQSWNNIYGDAMWETSSDVLGKYSWENGIADADKTEETEPFILRGSANYSGNSSSIFSFGDAMGGRPEDSQGFSYRIILIVEEKEAIKVDENGLATKNTTITTDDPNVQIVIPKGFAPVILQTDRTDSLPGENGAVKEIMPAKDWNSITAEQINKGIVVVDHAITYDGGNKTGTVSDFNEYVWIPITDSSKFARVAWDGSYGDGLSYKIGEQPLSEISTLNMFWENKTTQEYKDMLNSVSINKGFYISRYEASNNGSNIAQSKRNQEVWMNVSQTTSITASANMKTSINSHLIYGIEWDSVLNWLIGNAIISSSINGQTKIMELENIQTESSSWGNHSKSNSTGDAEIDSAVLQPTGTSEYWKANNIYDLAGNVAEWTQERYSTGAGCVSRGCSYGGGESPVAYRAGNEESMKITNIRI